MSLAVDVHISALDIPPHAGLEQTDARLRLNDFLNNRQPVGMLDPDKVQLIDFVVEEGYGERERAMFVRFGALCIEGKLITGKNESHLNDLETLRYDTTEYCDPVYSITNKAPYEGGPDRVISLIAVEGLFLFGHEHFVVQKDDRLEKTEPTPLNQNDYNRFKALADADSVAA